jgi:inosine-uridine nucleoside N-ribohydrolase
LSAIKESYQSLNKALLTLFLSFVKNTRTKFIMEKQKVIFDTDLGADDAWALITLLQSEKRCNIDLRAITVVAGNTDLHHACQNTLLVLKTLNRMDVPVYAGAEDSLIHKPDYKPTFFFPDGLKGAYKQEEKPSLDLLQKEHAVVALKKLIEEVRKY